MDNLIDKKDDAVSAAEMASKAGNDAMGDANDGKTAVDMEELENLKASIEAHQAIAEAQLLEAQNSYDAAVAARDNELTTAMSNVDPLKAETQADIDELTDIISQLDIIRVKFASI